MSDLIERPKSIGEAWRKLIQQQAEIERLQRGCDSLHNHIAGKDAEIERLQSERDGVVALYNASVKRVEQLQAVVEAFTDKLIKLPAKDRWELEELIAALEGADDE